MGGLFGIRRLIKAVVEDGLRGNEAARICRVRDPSAIRLGECVRETSRTTTWPTGGDGVLCLKPHRDWSWNCVAARRCGKTAARADRSDARCDQPSVCLRAPGVEKRQVVTVAPSSNARGYQLHSKKKRCSASEQHRPDRRLSRRGKREAWRSDSTSLGAPLLLASTRPATTRPR